MTTPRSEELLVRRCDDLAAVIQEQIALLPALAPLAGLLERLCALRRSASGNLVVLRDVLRCLRLLASLSSLLAMHVRMGGSVAHTKRPAPRERRRAGRGGDAGRVPWATAVAFGALAAASLAGTLAGPGAPARAPRLADSRHAGTPSRGPFTACIAGDPHCVPGAGTTQAPVKGPPALVTASGSGVTGVGASAARGVSVDRSLVTAGVGALASRHPLLALALAVVMPAVLALGPQGAEEDTSVELEPAAARNSQPPGASPLALLLLHLGLPFSASSPGAAGGDPDACPLAAATALAAELSRAYDLALDSLALRRHELAALLDSAESGEASPTSASQHEGLDAKVEGDAEDRGTALLHAVDALLLEHGVGCAEDSHLARRTHSSRPSGNEYLSLLARASSGEECAVAKAQGALPPHLSPMDAGFRAFALSPPTEVLARTRERVARVAGAVLGPPASAGVAVPAWYIQSAGCSICEVTWGEAGGAAVVVIVAPLPQPPAPASSRRLPEPRAVVCSRRHGLCVTCAGRLVERQRWQRRELAAAEAPPPAPAASLAELAWQAVSGWGTELLGGGPPAAPATNTALLPAGTPLACPACDVPGALQLLRFASG